jgi:hypothetical protein
MYPTKVQKLTQKMLRLDLAAVDLASRSGWHKDIFKFEYLKFAVVAWNNFNRLLRVEVLNIQTPST